MRWRWSGYGHDRRASQLTNRRTRRERLFVVLVGLACLVPHSVSARAPSTASPDAVEVAPRGPWPSPIQNLDKWRITREGIPYYADRPACAAADADTIAHEFGVDGADAATQQWAVYVASREGGCSFEVVTVNTASRDDSHCTFQLNARSGMFGPTGELGRLGWTAESVRQSMRSCADAASDLWAACGRGPWTPPYSCRRPNTSGATKPTS